MPEQSVEQAAAPSASCPFHKGDAVYLEKGSYQGTVGTFLNLKSDPKWADILEPNQKVRAHPVEWMALALKKVDGRTETRA
jgi:hypothetical protein